jgi:porphobilinogen synthase
MAIKFGRPIEMRDAPPRNPPGTTLAASALDLAVRPRRAAAQDGAGRPFPRS